MGGIEFLDQMVARDYCGGLVLMIGVDAEMLGVARTIAEDHGLRVLGVFLKPVSMEQISFF